MVPLHSHLHPFLHSGYQRSPTAVPRLRSCLWEHRLIYVMMQPPLRNSVGSSKSQSLSRQPRSLLARELGAVKYVVCSARTQQGLKMYLTKQFSQLLSLQSLFKGDDGGDGVWRDREGLGKRLNCCVCLSQFSLDIFVQHQLPVLHNTPQVQQTTHPHNVSADTVIAVFPIYSNYLQRTCTYILGPIKNYG